jgi:hypothetical protein
MRSSFRRSHSPDSVASSSKVRRFACRPRPPPTEVVCVVGSSLGVPQRPPLHQHPRVRPLSVARGSGLPHPNSFRPCRSSRLRRLPPHTASQVCCTLQPVMGFAWFRADRRLSPTPDPPPRRSFPFEALHQISGSLSPGPLPPRRWSAVPQHRCWSRFPRPRGTSSDLEFRHAPRCHGPCTSSLGFPRPRPSPEVSVAGGSCWFPSCPVLSHRVSTQRPLRSARRLPVFPFAGKDRGARDGYRVSHGLLQLPAPHAPFPACASSTPKGHPRVSDILPCAPLPEPPGEHPCSWGHHRPGSVEHRTPEGERRVSEPKLLARRGKSRGLARQRSRERGVFVGARQLA